MFNVVQRFSFCSMFSVVQCSFFNIDSHFLSRLSDPGPTALLKLADFGVAFECLTKRAAGTPNYMPLAVLEGKGPADKVHGHIRISMHSVRNGGRIVDGRESGGRAAASELAEQNYVGPQRKDSPKCVQCFA